MLTPLHRIPIYPLKKGEQYKKNMIGWLDCVLHYSGNISAT